MAVVTIVGASAGKQARILTRCPNLSGRHPKDKTPITSGASFSQKPEGFPAHQLAVMGWYKRRRSSSITKFTNFLPDADEFVGILPSTDT